MRRIVTGLNDEGRSTFTAIETIEDLPRVWEASLGERPAWIEGSGLAFDPSSTGWAYDPVPQPGRVMCWVNDVPPERAMAHEDDSWRVLHKQRSVDIVYVVDPIILVLEDGEIEAVAGDVIVQHATMHTFRNLGGAPAKLVGFSWGVEVP